MTNSLITCAYTLTVVGGSRSVASFEAAMAAVPVDLTLPRLYGLLYTSDVTGASGNLITRTMQFRMLPTSTAAAVSTLVPGDGSGSPLTSVILSGESPRGDGYARAPLVTFTSPKPPDRPALARARMRAGTVLVLQGGAGYSGTINATFENGELWPGGVQATGTVTLSGSSVLSVSVVTPGGPYGTYPDIVLSGTGLGAGAILTAGLQVDSFDLLDPGLGYVPGTPGSPPGVTLTPAFKSFFPDSANNQASSLAEFMRARFQYFLQAPVDALAPVVS